VVADSKHVGENCMVYCPSCLNAPIDMWTCWIPLADLNGGDSRLQVVAGSHRSISGYEKPLRNESTLLPSSFETAQRARELTWQTPGSIAMGDLILFNLKTVHRANRNKGGRSFRLSIDTRVTTCMPKVR
jgi:ectoine hydroxylase-related dioxygenase (phytanoyl-CoA dioxygenase family)